MKFIFLLLVLFSLQTLAVPVNCGSAVEALEISTLKKMTDPCEGRVCQHKCPCGEMIYFNLEYVLNNPSASQVYQDVCVMDASKVVTFLRGGRTNAGSTQVRSGTTTHVDDTGFVYQELKSAISACGFSELENIESFGKLKEKIESEVTKTISDPVTRAITRKTFNYPPNFLLQFAIKLKDFQKVCKEKSDWKEHLASNLNLKLNEVKQFHFSDLSFQTKCILDQCEVMKKNFEKLILESSNIQFCLCQKLTEHQITTTTRPSKYNKSVTYTTTPFSSYSSIIDRQCKKVCSGALILEYDE
jgi:hypothetical protein